jgi:hypothetical protein
VPSAPAVSLFRAAIYALPYAGGALDHLIFDKADAIRLRNIQASLAALSAQLEKVHESKIDKSWFESEEALAAFKLMADKVSYEPDPKKVDAVGRIVGACGNTEHSNDHRKLSRVGRLMITLYLVSKGILKQPILYLSDFFERNRNHYYDNLSRVREQNLQQWFKFFLVGVIETAKSGISTFDNILKLQKKVDEQIQTLGSRAANAQKVLHALYRHPVINAADVGRIAKISAASAYKLVADLERLKVLREITGGRRGRTYLFDSYVKFFR